MEGKNSGHWSSEERGKYFCFIQAHQANFVKKELRRSDKIFKLMSSFLGSRAADQCRSHHQKMEKKHGPLGSIIKALANLYSSEFAEDLIKGTFVDETKMNTPMPKDDEP